MCAKGKEWTELGVFVEQTWVEPMIGLIASTLHYPHSIIHTRLSTLAQINSAILSRK